MTDTLSDAAKILGFKGFTQPQEEAITAIQGGLERTCLYYPTGKGKSATALSGLWLAGAREVLVIAPPTTQQDWAHIAELFGMRVTLMSHAKFRMKDTKISKTTPIICDEFHMLGGRTGIGWKKFNRVAKAVEAQVVILSATPQYNDAERAYCIQMIQDPYSLKGGYEKFLYEHCILEPSFRGLPTVTGFKNYDSSEAYIAAIKGVFYLPDEALYEIEDIPVRYLMPQNWSDYGYDSRRDRIMASIIERKFSHMRFQLMGYDPRYDRLYLRDETEETLVQIIENTEGSVLIYCDHSTIAETVAFDLGVKVSNVYLLTGTMTTKIKNEVINKFRYSREKIILVGTSTMTTGTDGFDKVCHTLILYQDTPDDALRRQIIGRILPRGVDESQPDKRIIRFDYGKP